MAAQRFIALVTGKLKQVAAAVTSTPDAIVAMDATGHLDNSVMPVGVGAEVVVCAASENLTAGNFCNFHNNAGVINVRKSDATVAGKMTHGFVLTNVTAPANATVYLPSQTNTALSGLTVGADYYAHTTAGAASATPPAAPGNVLQYLGTAHSATAMVFTPGPTIELA